ncbi:MAG: end-binding protein Ku [Ilumatobacteraceae bacterium]|nr:end-binding protein Ku [Ilumatobacteraceae bacterium]
MAARSIWTGSITIGMLNIPVKLVSAVKRQSISFNQVDDRSGARIRYQKVAEATDELVEPEHIKKGFDLGGGHYVLIEDDDLKPLAPAKSKEIGIDTFVPAEQIPAAMYESSYIMLPGKIVKPYALLAQALAGSGKVGIGKFVMRQHEYLAAVRSDGEHLTLSTLAYPDEVVDPAEVEDLETVVGVELSDRELAMAGTLVEAMADPFDPATYRDEYRAQVMALIEAKAEGRTIKAEVAPERSTVVDLAAALEASVEAAKASRARHPTARPAAKKVAADAAAPVRRKKSA